MNEPASPAAELDAMHVEARAAFAKRDLARYRELFAPGLTYRQADGRVIDREQLLRDVATQFCRLDRWESSFARESLEWNGDRVTEVVTHTASAGVTVFFVLHRVWDVTRRGRYTWGRHEGRWRVEAVEILDERVVRRISVGLRTEPLSSSVPAP